MYRKYLKTEAWQIIRNKALVRDLCLCQECGSKKRLEVHHLTYKRVGKELLSDLKTLCRKCHLKQHNK